MDLKKISFYCILLVSVLATACIKDRTNMNLTKISPIVIDTTGVPAAFSVFQLDTLKVMPKTTKEGFNADNLKYEWTMNAFGGYKRVIGTQKTVTAQITEAPSSIAYTVILTVTDSVTNQKGFYTWSVNVMSRFGEGLIVADTRDGVSSDLNLIMARNFTASVIDESNNKIFRNIYSSVNGEAVNGLIKAISYVNNANTKSLTFATDNSFTRIDPTSYKRKQRDKELFIIAPDVIKPDAIYPINPSSNQHEYLVNDGKVYSRWGTNLNWIYPHMADSKGYSCKQICGLQAQTSPGGAIYDDLNSRFLLLPSATSNAVALTTIPALDVAASPAFDPNNIGNKTCLFMQEGQNKRIVSVMKDRDQAKYYAYQLRATTPIDGKMGYSLHDLSGNPEIGQSKFYATSTGEEVLFYATDTKIYASILLVGGATNVNLRYTVPAEEKITGMQMHIRNGSTYIPSLIDPSDYSLKSSVLSANRLLLISTYNESTKEGKIVAIPLQTVGVGGLATDPAYIRTYGGFNKITAFNFQGT